MIDTISTAVQNNDDGNDNNQIGIIRPRILLTGLRRSGKTSIQRVIFAKISPSQTQFLESTSHLTLNEFSCGSFIHFQVQEIPGQLHVSQSFINSNNVNKNLQRSSTLDENAGHVVGGGYDMERLLKQCNAVVYIIDAQDDYRESIGRLNNIIQLGRQVNPKIRYEVFIHKVDQLTEDAKIDTQRDIHNQVRDYLADSVDGMDLWMAPSSTSKLQDILINFHLTSIFDHSIFEAFSKVIQKLLPQFNYLENLLTHLLSASNIEQAFLFDIQTKISIASDSSPTDMQMYELCCDMIDLLLQMSEIYGKVNINDPETTNQGDYHTGIDNSYSENTTQPTDEPYPFLLETTSRPASNVFDSMSSSVIKLNGGRALYLKEINQHLALICILREEALSRQAIIDYNVKQLKESILRLFHLDHLTSITQ